MKLYRGASVAIPSITDKEAVISYSQGWENSSFSIERLGLIGKGIENTFNESGTFEATESELRSTLYWLVRREHYDSEPFSNELAGAILDRLGGISNRKNGLLLDIAKCPVASFCATDSCALSDGDHECHTVVRSQGSNPEEFHIPEPWTGRIHEAPILFVSSNPSFSEDEPFPLLTQDAAGTVEFFENRFETGEPKLMIDGTRSLRNDGTYGSPTGFWAEIKKQVERAIPDRPVVPGRDYALTELVHCKSRSEQGVPQALDYCSERYFTRVLRLAAASVVVVIGKKARAVVSEMMNLDSIPDVNTWADSALGGKKRLWVFSGAPSGSEQRVFKGQLLEAIQFHLNDC